MSENPKNMHRHGTGGIIFASILLICIALISLIITFSALSRDDDDGYRRKDPDTENTDDGTSEDEGNGEENNNGENGDNKNDDTPKNTAVDKKNDDVYRGPLIQINADNPYSRPAEDLISTSAMESLSPGEILSRYNFISVSSRSDGNFKPRNRLLYLDVDAAEAFCQMMKDFVAETGVTYIQLKDAYANRGLTDPHSAGLAVDLNIYDGGLTYPLKNYYAKYRAHHSWFINNCHKYGFIHIQDTSSHSTFRYIGDPHATYMKNNNLTFDSYLDLVRTKTADDRLVITDANGNEWWIYYVKASDGDTTSIRIFGNEYSISGDNVGGFIVAVDTSGI